MKIIKFYIKVMMKTPILVISLLFNIFILSAQIGALKHSIYKFTDVSCYTFICSNLFVLLMSVYTLNKNFKILNLLEVNKFKKYVFIIITNILISIFMLMIPILFIIIIGIGRFDISIIISGILNYLIIGTLANAFAGTLGASIGILMKKWYSYIISILIYGIYVYYIFDYPTSVIGRFLSIFSDSTFIERNVLAPNLFNVSYYLDKLFILFLILFMISIVYSVINKKKKRVKGIIFLCIVCICMRFIVFAGEKITKFGVSPYEKVSSNSYVVKSYNMDLSLDKILKNNVIIDLYAEEDANSINLSLDDVFLIKDISVNQSKVNFVHRNNNISFDYNLNKGDNIKITINYLGIVDITNDLGVNTYYVDDKYINMPIKSFYWYPKLNDDLQCNYHVNLETPAIVYSNLDILNKSIDSNKKVYELSGIDLGVNIFAGDYKSIILDEVDYIIPKNYNINLLKKVVNDNFKEFAYKKVIVSTWDSSSCNNSEEILYQKFKDSINMNS